MARSVKDGKITTTVISDNVDVVCNARMVNTSNRYYARLETTGGNEWIMRVSGGTTTQLGSSGYYAEGAVASFRVQGTTLQLISGGTTLLTLTDSVLSSPGDWTVTGGASESAFESYDVAELSILPHVHHYEMSRRA